MHIIISKERASLAAYIHANRFFLLGQCLSVIDNYEPKGRGHDDMGEFFYKVGKLVEGKR